MNDVRGICVLMIDKMINRPNPQLDYRKCSATTNLFLTLSLQVLFNFFFVVTQIDSIHLLRLQQTPINFRTHY